MNLKFYLEKLYASEEFEQFRKENPEAFLCSGFFIIDKQGQDNKQHFDFYLPSERKMFSFQLEERTKIVPVELLNNKIPKKILLNYDFDFKDIEELIINEMKRQNIKNKIQKILLSLQNLDGKDFLVGTVFISTLGLLKINIDISQKKITEFAKTSFFDMIKVIKKKNKSNSQVSQQRK